MKYLPILLAAVFVCSPAEAAKKKKKKPKATVEVTDHYDVPCLYGENGSVNKEFFDDFKNIVAKSNSCVDGDYRVGEGDDPVWKARMYITQMRKLTTDMPLLIAIDAGDYQTNHIADIGISLDKKVRAIGQTSSLDTVSKILNVAGSVPGPTGAVAKGAKGAVDGLSFALKMLDKYEKAQKPKYDLEQDVKTQMGGIQDERNKLIQKFQRLRHNFDDILGALDGNENDIKDLTPENQELLRVTVCRFAPKKDDGFAHYGKFCSAQNGGEDFSNFRGTASCQDVHAINDKNLPLTKRVIKANFARHIAENVVVADRSGMFPDGHPARWEINFKSPPPVFAAPGGDQLLCQILQDPKYDEFWIEGSPRVLKDTLRIRDIGFPAIYKSPGGHLVGNGDHWHYAKSVPDYYDGGTQWDVELMKLGDNVKTQRATNRAYDYVVEQGKDKHNPKVVDIVKKQCNRDY